VHVIIDYSRKHILSRGVNLQVFWKLPLELLRSITLMTKKELEAYAALILIKTTQICEPLSTDWLKDRPDLQIGNFGIEVTEAIDEKGGEQRQLDSRILKCELDRKLLFYI
jgi:hypothetical protein